MRIGGQFQSSNVLPLFCQKVECCGYPLSIFFILVTEFCERFSYYGIRGILPLYITKFLLWDTHNEFYMYYAFLACLYLAPILGGIIADSWLGTFKTIIYLSIVSAAGQVVLTVSAIDDITVPDNLTVHRVLAVIGLVLIVLGTGTIRPCLPAFGGDQFEHHQTRQRSIFFSVFFLCKEAGLLVSIFISPILRRQKCGIQVCYPLVSGVAAALMVVALVVFVVGSRMYVKTAPTGNIILQVSKCIGFAIKNRYRHRSSQYPPREHWMDWASDKYDKLLIQQIKMVLKALFLFLPLPMFWMVLDQEGAHWSMQAMGMDGDFGFIIVQYDQMQTLLPILNIILVPVAGLLIYLIEKCGFKVLPLKRMAVGMFLTAMAFISAGFVQLEVDANGEYLTLDYGSYEDVYLDNELVHVRVFSGTRQTLVINPAPHVGMIRYDDVNGKPHGDNYVRFISGLSTGVRVSLNGVYFGQLSTLVMSGYSSVSHERQTFTISNVAGQQCDYTREFGFGGVYTIVIPSTLSWENCGGIQEVEEMQPNSVHMALQIPQYFFISAGEVLFAVAGLEFSYSQAPSNMKTVLQAVWLFTLSMGFFISLLVNEVSEILQTSENFEMKEWAEYILFASLLLVVCVIFSIMAYFYTYIDPVAIEAEFKRKEGLDSDETDENDELEMKEKESQHHDNEEGLKQSKM
ncbi:solute carrier family 15 member 1-like [Engraulis encrasicolus]|uniref:solute carrier family 15 member 1-like n=1 Tax=Engraulis encrasicolus TaxID=184585 RepID=UPI002FD30855